MTAVPRRPAPGSRLILRDIDWKTYTRLVGVIAERPRVRLTYDRGTLEITRPRLGHIGQTEFLGQLVIALADELALPCMAGGSTTLRRRRNKRGLEPDRCYWIANEARVRGKNRLDLRVDPPPDLAIEVDVTSSSLDRMQIYAALGVPEVWRLEGGKLTFHLLAGGQYSAGTRSRSFPGVEPQELMGFVALRDSQDETSVRAQFRAWFRGRMAANAGNAGQP
jgi:Uma2 family endonuclease